MGVNALFLYPKNSGTDPINKASVSSPKAIPLLLSNILLSAINVIGIVILKNSIASIPKIELLNANIKHMADTPNEITDIFLNPILSPIIPPNIFPKITAKIETIAKIKLFFHENDNIL